MRIPRIVSVLLVSIYSISLIGQTSAAHPKKTAKSSGSMMAMPLVAPLFIQDANFSSTLVLVNNSARATYADVVVRDLTGESIAKRRVMMDPFGQSHLSLKEVVESGGAIATNGSILVMQSPDLQGMTVAAQLLLTYRGSPQPNYVDEELAMLSADGSQMLRAVADRSIGSPLVAISSVSDMPQHIRLQCVTENGAGAAKTLVVSPGETIVTEACTATALHGADFAAVSDNVSYGPERAFGVALASDAMPGSFAAFALAPHGAKDDVYFSSVPFSDPMMAMSPNTVFAGVPVGSAKWLPKGNYVPQVSVANFGSRAAHVRVEYSSGPATPAAGTLAPTESTNDTIRDVANLTIAPGTVRSIILDRLSGEPEMRSSFVVSSDSRPGDVVTKLVSTSGSGLREVELLGKDEEDQENGGGHPWSLEDGTDSVLLLFNHTNKPQVYNVAIASGAILWQKLVTVSPMQTDSIDFRELIVERIKDDKGRILSPTALSGSVSWWSPNPEQGRGRLLQANKQMMMARSFSCGYYVVLCGASFLPGTESWLLEDTVGFGQVEGNTCTAWGPNYCSGEQYGTGTGYSYSWMSYKSGIARISGSSTSQSVSTFGAGGGNTTVQGTVSSNYCQSSGSGPGSVRVPTRTQVVADVAQEDSQANCQANHLAGDGWYRQVKVQVVDQWGVPLTYDGQLINETLTQTGQDGLKLGKGQIITCTELGTCPSTSGGGYFQDILAGCSTLCPGSTGETDYTQVVTYNGIPLASNIFGYQCKASLYNGSSKH